MFALWRDKMQTNEQLKLDMLIARANLLAITKKDAKVGDLFKDENKKPIDHKKYAFGWVNYA